MKLMQLYRRCVSVNNFNTAQLGWRMSVIGWMWWDASDSHIHCPRAFPYLSPCAPLYLSTSPWRSEGRLWLGRAGWSGAASGPIGRLGWSWPSSGSSPVQTARPACTTDRQTETDYSLDRHRCPDAVDKVLLPHHSDSLQVDLGAAQLLPGVVLVALSLGDAAELARGLKHVLHQRAAAHLISRDLSGRRGQRNTRLGVLGNITQHCFFFFPRSGGTPADQPLGLWNVPDTEPAAACSRFYSEGCRRRRRGGSPWETDRQVSDWWQTDKQTTVQTDRFITDE